MLQFSIFNHEEQEKYERQIKELKNYKYRQLKRGKYTEYIKSKKQFQIEHQE